MNMKKLIAAAIASTMLALGAWAQSTQPTVPLGTYQATPFLGQGFMWTATNAYSALSSLGFSGTISSNLPIGNGAGLTNLTGLLWTNSAASFATSGKPFTAPAAGLLTVSVETTNAALVAVSNATSTVVIFMGGVTALGTNCWSATMPCNSADNVVVTNLTGTVATLGSWFQVLH